MMKKATKLMLKSFTFLDESQKIINKIENFFDVICLLSWI